MLVGDSSGEYSVDEPLRTVTTKSPSYTTVVKTVLGVPSCARLTRDQVAWAMGWPQSYLHPIPSMPLREVDKGYGGAVCPPVGSALVAAVVSGMVTSREVMLNMGT